MRGGEESHTESLGSNAGLFPGIRYPVVILERMHRLEHGTNTTNIRVNLGISKKLSSQIRVELHLNCNRSVNP